MTLELKLKDRILRPIKRGSSFYSLGRIEAGWSMRPASHTRVTRSKSNRLLSMSSRTRLQAPLSTTISWRSHSGVLRTKSGGRNAEYDSLQFWPRGGEEGGQVQHPHEAQARPAGPEQRAQTEPGAMWGQSSPRLSRLPVLSVLAQHQQEVTIHTFTQSILKELIGLAGPPLRYTFLQYQIQLLTVFHSRRRSKKWKNVFKSKTSR